jgi:hypothetical protein
MALHPDYLNALIDVRVAELRIAQANNDKTKLLDLPRLPRPHMN